ncbi:MAG: hypothetical protein JO362_14315 [Streptomycetaceae bacterium]|nr:hypothetical protein [Streptomycetaceae bacterium]
MRFIVPSAEIRHHTIAVVDQIWAVSRHGTRGHPGAPVAAHQLVRRGDGDVLLRRGDGGVGQQAKLVGLLAARSRERTAGRPARRGGMADRSVASRSAAA